MRNIFLEDLKHFKLCSGEISSIEASIINEFSSTVYLLTNSKTLYTIIFTRDFTSIISVDEKSLSSSIKKEQQVLSFSQLKYNNSLIIFLRDGFIYKYDLLLEALEEIGEQEEGFHAGELSPNEELIVVATGTGTNSQILFDKDFQFIDEKPVVEDGNEFYNKKLESVKIVWRYDSEFFNVLVKTDEGVKSITKDKNLNTFISPAKSDEDGGLVQSVTEKWNQNFSGKSQVWQPNGGQIMSDEVLEKKDGKKETRVVCWEKNSLRHGEFTLPSFNPDSDCKTEIEEMSWNKSTQIQAILCKDDKRQMVLLYLRSNYKWFLKKVIPISSDKVVQMRFCQKSQWDLYLCQENDGFSVQNLSLKLHKGVYSCPLNQEHNALSVSIDYSNLLITPYHKLQIPPPMSHFNLALDTFPKVVFVAKNAVQSILDDGTQVVYDYQYSDEVTKYVLEKKLLDTHYHVLKFNALREDENQFSLAFVKTDLRDYGILQNQKKLCIVDISLSKDGKTIDIKKTTEKEFTIVGEENNPPSLLVGNFDAVPQDNIKLIFNSSSHFYFLYNDNTIKRLEDKCKLTNAGSLKTDLNVIDLEWYDVELQTKSSNKKKFSEVLSNKSEENQSEEKTTNNINYFGLTADDKLIHNGNLVINDCTSYCIADNKFLLFTTLNQGMYDLLHTYTLEEINKGQANTLITSQITKSTDGKSHYIRNVERGSRIVQCADNRLVFQQPRGNLEAINPRLQMVHKVKEGLLAKEYQKTYVYLRKNKQDMNLLIDIYPEEIVKDIKNGSFLKGIKKIDDLNIILTSMNENLSEDLNYLLTEDEISKNRKYFTEQNSKFNDSKINFISEVFKTEMMKDVENYIFSVMVIYTIKKPDELKNALDHIRDIQQKEESIASDKKNITQAPHMNPDTNKKFKASRTKTSSQVQEYLTWLSDANKLYNVALNTFDLDLAIMVAEYTQKDPKEYLPYIERLRKIENPIEQKQKICQDMKNYKQAINVQSYGTEENIKNSVEIMKEHKMYKHAMIVYKDNLSVSKTIKNHFGDHLRNTGNIKQSAIVYQSCQQWEKAILSYEDTLDWKGGKKQMEFLQKDSKDIDAFLNNMKESYLKSNQGYSEAAKIHKAIKNYDRKEYIELVVRAEDWRSLKKFPINYSTGDALVVKQKILPAQNLAAELKINEIWKLCLEFKKWELRLFAVQEKKKNSLYLILGEDGNETTYDTQSEFSMYSRGSSKFSVVTGASMVKGTKKPKKPKNLTSRVCKEGSLFEEEWLVDRLNEIKIEESESLLVTHLIDSLVIFEEADKAVEIITQYRKLGDLIKRRGSGKSNWVKTLAQSEFETANPEVADLYGHIDEFQRREDLENKKKRKEDKKGAEEKKIFSKYEFLLI